MVSVIVPIYKVEAYLKKCIESIQNQSYEDLEIILVDDGSPDLCGKICDDYATRDARIRVIHKENGGLSDARNAGIAVARGAYLQFVDSDDYIHPKMTEILLKNLQQADADISFCAYENVNEDDAAKVPWEPGDNPICNSTSNGKQGIEEDIVPFQKLECFEGEEVMNRLQRDNDRTVVAWNKLYKAELFESLRYEKGRLHEDEYLIHHLLHLAKRSVYTDLKLYYYVQHIGSITEKMNPKRILDIYDAYKGRLEFLQENQYAYMAECTKRHILYTIYRFYNQLDGKHKALKKEMQNVFCEYAKDEKVLSGVAYDLRGDYKIFAISPALYYNSRGIVGLYRKAKKGTKFVLRKLLKKQSGR